MASVRLKVSGMTCEHCVAKVEKALTGTSGVWSAFVDLDAGTAEVDFDDGKVQADRLAETVSAAGYAATVDA
ncbi:MAG: heavy-metal-associated domain-containing protein [Gemmatimonadota bacterium]|nr:MAG: heavy-metal-associated domain-containing protein [Gemmatimonadota bacterium]